MYDSNFGATLLNGMYRMNVVLTGIGTYQTDGQELCWSLTVLKMMLP